jgi:hypothetical protein
MQHKKRGTTQCASRLSSCGFNMVIALWPYLIERGFVESAAIGPFLAY